MQNISLINKYKMKRNIIVLNNEKIIIWITSKRIKSKDHKQLTEEIKELEKRK